MKLVENHQRRFRNISISRPGFEKKRFHPGDRVGPANNFFDGMHSVHPSPAGLERYYKGFLYLMALLHCSGEFQIWSPSTITNQ